MGKSELAAAVALLITCGDGEERTEMYGCAADRQQATIVFDVAADMVRMCLHSSGRAESEEPRNRSCSSSHARSENFAGTCGSFSCQLCG